MEDLTLRYDHVQQALHTLSAVVSDYQKILERQGSIDRAILRDEQRLLSFDVEHIRIYMRDSVIKRLEFSIKVLWKYLKDYLEIKHGIIPDVLSPQQVFRACAQARLISEEDARLALNIALDRNLTSHMYKEEVAEIICKRAPDYLAAMYRILNAMPPL